MKFITRLRNKFSQIFDHALEKQLVLKGICSMDEWRQFREDIYYDYMKDNNFTELRDTELLTSRVQLLATVDPYMGRYFSAKWVKKNILQQTDEDVEAMEKQMAEEAEQGVGQPLQQPGMEQEQVSAEEYPPEDNTQENGASESMTPMLDAEVEKYSSLLNRR